MRSGHCADDGKRHLTAFKIYEATVSSIKSVSNMPDITAGSEHTKNVCLNSRPSNPKETDCDPLTSSVSPVKPYGFVFVILTLLLDTRGCSFHTLELVSNINLLISPFILTSIERERERAPHSNSTEAVGVVALLLGAERWKELSSFTPSRRFRNSVLLPEFHACF